MQKIFTASPELDQFIGRLEIIAREFMSFAGNSAKSLGSRKEGYVSINDNTPKKLPHLSPKSCRNFT